MHPIYGTLPLEDFNFDPLGLAVKCEKYLPWFREAPMGRWVFPGRIRLMAEPFISFYDILEIMVFIWGIIPFYGLISGGHMAQDLPAGVTDTLGRANLGPANLCCCHGISTLG